MNPAYLLDMARSYVQTIAVESMILAWLLSRRHSLPRRLFAGVWLTACTYPLLWLALPAIFPPERSRAAFLVVGETLVAVGECALFWAAFIRGLPPQPRRTLRDFSAVVLANLASFGVGEWLHAWKP